MFDDEKNLMASLAHEGDTFCDDCEEWVPDDGRHECPTSDWREPDTVWEARGEK